MKNVPLKIVDGFANARNAGDGYWLPNAESPERLHFLCPCGCGSTAGIAVKGEHAWQWDGDKEKPTATPSILVNGRGQGCGWHGYLTNGVFQEC